MAQPQSPSPPVSRAAAPPVSRSPAPPAARPPMREASTSAQPSTRTHPSTRAQEQRPAQRDLSFLREDDDAGGPFQIDRSAMPDGMSYEWSRVTYAGKEDVRQQARRQRHQWTPVPKKRHPEIVGREAAARDPEGAIIVDGLMLMERPAFITDEADDIRTNKARDRVRNQVKSLKLTPEGQLPRVRAQAKKKYNIQVAEPDETAAGAAGAEEE
jgi:hypothetical protein